MTKDLFIVLSVHAFSLLVLLQPGDQEEDHGYVPDDGAVDGDENQDDDFVVNHRG